MDVAKLTPKRLFFDLNQTLIMKTDGVFFSRKTGMNLNKARKSSNNYNFIASRAFQKISTSDLLDFCMKLKDQQ